MATSPSGGGSLLRACGRTEGEITQHSDRLLAAFVTQFEALGWTTPQMSLVLMRMLLSLTLADPFHPLAQQAAWSRALRDMWRVAVTSSGEER